MSTPALEVVEFLLTAHVYNENRELDENDLPPRYRRVFWAERDGDTDTDTDSAEVEPLGGVERPLSVTETDARTATGVERPWEAVSDLLFTDRTEFSGTLSFTQPEMALEWYLKRADRDRLVTNPTLAFVAEGRDGIDVTHEEAREQNRPIHADRVWIDSLLEAYFDTDDEEGDAEMLDLVHVRAPEEIEMTLDDLVLTSDQEGEISKIVKAIEHRDYLAEIGLREIGKLLFVGPPGTGKTTISRALAHELGLPFVEVKLSMITSQYLGETAKNVEKTFEVAKRLSPCILFIDEFDSVAKTRRSDEHAALKRAVNTLLKSIDDISLIRDDVLLIGATNHPDQLDAAAWRRFDEIVNFPKPDRQMRADILRVITQRMDIAEFDPESVADRTEGLTGSDLRLVLREAVLEALTEERMSLTQDDILDAVADFEERDNLKNMDMMDSDSDSLIAGNGESSDASDHGDDHDHAHDHQH
ncbi:ATP-binding protein [Haloprofundus halophilus]|uniref:ATP-binding protein n=1 Tax=Haloprofundus halophilus TaxID=2283527 RepID=UPI000E436022|nr:ATP-binding protein [Haloprofundus halophilus]